MIYIRANIENQIEVISNEIIQVYTCIVNKLPTDFYIYLSEGKYLANQNGIYIKPNWIDYDMLEVPVNPIMEYVMSSKCPVDETLKRKVYWVGEEHVVDSYFKVKIYVLHFNQDGSRNRIYDRITWTSADKGVMIVNPLNEEEMVDEYDLFKDMINTSYMPHLVQLGIYCAEPALNNRIYS
jgi:hypothetical protein